MRRASHDALTKSAVQRYHPIQTKEANILAASLLKNPQDRRQHFMRAAASTIMAILYDYPSLPSEHDNAIEQVERITQWFSLIVGIGTSLVEYFPWMLHIPQRYTLSS
jgi:cytochrome P450